MTTGVLLAAPLRRFECPSCGRTLAKRDPRVTTEMHICVKQAMMLVPFVELLPGQDALPKHATRHVLVERGDYIGAEQGVAHDENGRAVMAVNTERADGSQDCAVFAPIATGERS